MKNKLFYAVLVAILAYRRYRMIEFGAVSLIASRFHTVVPVLKDIGFPDKPFKISSIEHQSIVSVNVEVNSEMSLNED